jgi:hypothetical protein
MRKVILTAMLTAALTAPALGANYPVSGRWGESAGSKKGAIDCTGLRVVTFSGNQRTDTAGGVPAYRNHSVTADGPAQYRIVDEFTNGQISAAYANYTLRVLDADHIVLLMQEGGTLKLQRCK